MLASEFLLNVSFIPMAELLLCKLDMAYIVLLYNGDLHGL